jgi:predicted nucleic acid-binding protein
MNLILDSGALIAMERGDRAMWRRFALSIEAGIPPLTHGGVVAQVWRGAGPRSALLSRALASTDVIPLTDNIGRRAGELLARARRADVVDAALVILARDDDAIATSDADDLLPLTRAAGRYVELIEV